MSTEGIKRLAGKNEKRGSASADFFAGDFTAFTFGISCGIIRKADDLSIKGGVHSITRREI